MNNQAEKRTLGDKITMLIVGILMCYSFVWGMEWHYKNNVLPTFTQEDAREMEFLRNLSLVESWRYYKRNIEVNGFNLLKDESDVRAYELGGIIK